MKAFPEPNNDTRLEKGMTLRDYFAAAALQGYLANTDFTHYEPDEKATIAFDMADLMLKQRGITNE